MEPSLPSQQAENVKVLSTDELQKIDRLLREHQILKRSGEYFPILTEGLGAQDNTHCYSGNSGLTILHAAAMKNSDKVIELLLGYGFDVNQTDNSLRTPLHYAAQHDFPNAAKALFKHGANANLIDASGATPLFLAVEYQATSPESEDTVEYFLRRKEVQKNAKCRGKTVLHLAIEKDLPDRWIDLLAENGVDTEIKNDENKTALELAQEKIGLTSNEFNDNQNVIARLKYHKEYPPQK